MYNNPTAKQIAHLVRKKPKGFVYQFGNTDMRIPMTYYKAHLPMLVAPTDPKSLWEELGYSWVTTNRKADIVVCGDMLRKNFNVNNAMNDMWTRCKLNGNIVITHTSGISDDLLSIQPNYWIELAKLNEMELGISYFSMGDIKGQHQVAIDSGNTYTMSELRDSLHKFVETREIITNITLVKLSTKELVCP